MATYSIYDGSTIDVSVTDMPGTFLGINSVSWGSSLDAQKVLGAGGKWLGITPGIVSADDGTLELHNSELLNWLDATGGTYGFHRQSFDVTITYRTANLPLVTIVLQGCRATNVSNTHAFGAENLTSTVTFMVTDVIVNGKGIIGKVLGEVLSLVRVAGLF